MKVLWITNTIFPASCKALGIPVPITGGWRYGLAMQVAAVKGIHLAVATTYNGLEFKNFKIDEVIYYLLPAKLTTSYQKRLKPHWVKNMK